MAFLNHTISKYVIRLGKRIKQLCKKEDGILDGNIKGAILVKNRTGDGRTFLPGENVRNLSC
jgi:hypothetical protein